MCVWGNRMFPYFIVIDSAEDADLVYQNLSTQNTQAYS